MTTLQGPPETRRWPSIDHARPSEQGGPTARIGFNYQDEVAVGFFIDMLSDPSILKLHCESHDDIVVVRTNDPLAIAEFIQVKGAELNKLWSVADLCRPENGPGTSIFEVSLSRDTHDEISRFRIVTLRPVVDDLKVLTFPYGTSGREPCGARFLALHGELHKRFPAIRSAKGNSAAYWLKHCLWDVRPSEAFLAQSNSHRLLRYASADGKALLIEQGEILLGELRHWAKTAGQARWEPDSALKIITREQLRSWWERRTAEIIEGVSTISGGKLARKMRDAVLTDDQVRMAVDLRRDYARTIRTSRYMEEDEARRLQQRVKSELASLRARFIAGDIPLDSTGFHALCLDRMDALNAERVAGTEDRSAFLKGCMYDISDRCLHQFVRPIP
jgi:hypothetical protein